MLAVVLLAAAMPTGRYIARAAAAEASILARRRPIPELIADPRTPPATRDKLALVLEARQFAEDSLGLRAGDSYTQFTQLDSDTLVLVVSAAYRDRLARKGWWFPIVGRVPYKGFFDPADAAREGERLTRDGFDVNIRPASAFSTLGWFNDPLLSTTLRSDSLRLVDTVIHELLHSTYYAAGAAVFNESFANFVGARGAQRFFAARGDTAAVARLQARWHDQKLMGRVWTDAYSAVESAFARYPDDSSARVAARDTVFARLRQTLLTEIAPRLRATDPESLRRLRLDNAVLMSRRVYLTELQRFDDRWVREGGDLRATIRGVIEDHRTGRLGDSPAAGEAGSPLD